MGLSAAERDTPEYEYWWRETRWLPHRNSIEDVDALLIRLQEVKGKAFMTYEDVRAVLQSASPEEEVGQLIGTSVPAKRSRRIGLPKRTCTWSEGDEKCDAEVIRNAKFCPFHAKLSKNRSNRTFRLRERKSSPSTALAK